MFGRHPGRYRAPRRHLAIRLGVAPNSGAGGAAILQARSNVVGPYSSIQHNRPPRPGGWAYISALVLATTHSIASDTATCIFSGFISPLPVNAGQQRSDWMIESALIHIDDIPGQGLLLQGGIALSTSSSSRLAYPVIPRALRSGHRIGKNHPGHAPHAPVPSVRVVLAVPVPRSPAEGQLGSLRWSISLRMLRLLFQG